MKNLMLMKINDNQIVLKENIPSFFLSILPILVLIVIIFVGSAMKVANIVLIGLGAAVIISAIVFHRYIPSHKAST